MKVILYGTQWAKFRLVGLLQKSDFIPIAGRC